MFFASLEQNETKTISSNETINVDFNNKPANLFFEEQSKPPVEEPVFNNLNTSSFYVSSEPISTEKSLKTRVIDMHRQGLSLDLIAEKNNVSVTEVQMIVNMFG